jgi:hypothetical protein
MSFFVQPEEPTRHVTANEPRIGLSLKTERRKTPEAKRCAKMPTLVQRQHPAISDND